MKAKRNSPSAIDMPALTIADLPPTEKARITGLVDRLMSLGHEHEETMSHLSNERARHASEIDAANRRIEEELGIADSKLLQQSETIQQLQEQRSSAFAMLRQYQARLEKYAVDLQLKDKSEVDQSLKLKMLEDELSRLEKVIENQRLSIDDIESANMSAKKAFNETLKLAEDRDRKTSEEREVAVEGIKKSERRCLGLETAVSGLTKQITSMKKSTDTKDEQIIELLKTVELSRLALETAKAEAEASKYAALVAVAVSTAPSSSSKTKSTNKRWIQSANTLTSSRTSSEMLLFDTMDTNTIEGELTDAGRSGSSRDPERKARKKKRVITARKPMQIQYTEQESVPQQISLTKETMTTTRRHQPSVILLHKKMISLGKSGNNVSEKLTRAKSSLEVELGENRQYDTSLLHLLESM